MNTDGKAPFRLPRASPKSVRCRLPETGLFPRYYPWLFRSRASVASGRPREREGLRDIRERAGETPSDGIASFLDSERLPQAESHLLSIIRKYPNSPPIETVEHTQRRTPSASCTYGEAHTSPGFCYQARQSNDHRRTRGCRRMPFGR